MSSTASTHGSPLEQAVVSGNREFVYKFLAFQEENKKKMVQSVPEESLIALLEFLVAIFERKEMRYEVITTIQSILIWRKTSFKAASVRTRDENGVSAYDARMQALRRVLVAINKEKVDINKLHELKGRLEFIRECVDDRKEEEENVPICIEE
ncbi:hypothetical protein NEDG_01894 [Nematocida displodere]|uniref:Uncharacterized protein n=1 Tax=Nematocida displodere TaxID=1805483 RepID=A0A177EIA2_9MICR|nr:hypothetical protein NEDG_01894 [Nematocida displodere]